MLTWHNTLDCSRGIHLMQEILPIVNQLRYSYFVLGSRDDDPVYQLWSDMHMNPIHLTTRYTRRDIK